VAVGGLSDAHRAAEVGPHFAEALEGAACGLSLLTATLGRRPNQAYLSAVASAAGRRGGPVQRILAAYRI
jgi:hypothetical protein